MIGSLSYEDVMNIAAQVGSNVRASLFYMADLIEAHNEQYPENVVDPVSAIQAATIKFTKPSGSMIGGFMAQFNVLFVQVVPTDPNNMLGHILSPGYLVIPTDFLQDFKNFVLNAHAEAVNNIVDAYNEPDEDEEYEDGEEVGEEEGGEEGGEAPNLDAYATEAPAPNEEV
jgi:hypothetical protein